MTEGGGFEAMSDPEFLAERRRVREELQILTERYREINQEFDRRAQTAWTPARLGRGPVDRAQDEFGDSAAGRGGRDELERGGLL
jgi:hypothetical protein